MRPNPVDVFGDGGKYKGFPFKATLYTSKSITVEAPAVDYSDAGNDDDAFRDLLGITDDEILAERVPANRATLAQKKVFNDVILGAFENATNSFVEKVAKKGRNKMQYVLQFPNTVELSAEVLDVHKNKKDNELHMEGLPVKTDIDKDNQLDDAGDLPKITMEVENMDVEVSVWSTHSAPRLVWRIADLSKESRQRGRVDSDSEDSATEAAKAMQKLNVRAVKKKAPGKKKKS